MKIITGFLLILLLISAGFAQKKDESALVLARAEKAVSTLKSFSAQEKNSVPSEIFSKAKAIGVFSQARRINMILEEWVDVRGVVSVRNGEKWSTPLFAFFASFGVSHKLADKKTYDIIFFVMDDLSVELLKKGKLKLNLTPGAAVRGNDAESVIKKASVIYYAIDGGKLLTEANGYLFSGVSSVISLDNKSNKRIYNQTGQVILTNAPTSLPVLPSAERFHQAMGELFTPAN